MPRIAVTAITVAIDGVAERSSTTIGAVGGYAVVVATALPDRAITLTSSYLSAMVGDIGASHLCSTPGQPPQIEQRVLAGDRLGRTHAQACLLDHVAELQMRLAALTDDTRVTIDLNESALQAADRAWSTEDRG